MHTAFEKLPEEKREAIIAICIEEFANNGYENTSTDVITSRAGISKGILFHYFKSKKNLYLYIMNYVVSFITDRAMEEFEKNKTQDF
ncbi:MAG: TetR/AcrR family transcriptional regulator, partial [Bacillota bacterium]|nr:TetR/AcrR family transcriptional regulator [Bacillota bacterium]